MNTYSIISVTTNRNNRAVLEIRIGFRTQTITVSMNDLKTIFGLNSLEGMKYVHFPTAECQMRDTVVVSDKNVDLLITDLLMHRIVIVQPYQEYGEPEVFVNKDFEDVCDYFMSQI